MDWKKEKESLRKAEEFENKEWFKPEAGTHKIKILKEGSEFTTTIDNKTIDKFRFDIEVNSKTLNWGVTKGITANSLWGQLCLLADSWNGLEGKEITLMVKGTGKQKDYTIQEALPLMVKVEDVK